MLLIIIDKIIIGKATIKYLAKEIFSPWIAAILATTTLALAPISVPFPPRHAPNDNAHHNGSKFVIPIAPISLIIGMRVATNGMLSINAEAIALNHKISIVVLVKSPAVISNTFSANNLITPVSTNPPTKMNKPAKKKIASHSI